MAGNAPLHIIITIASIFTWRPLIRAGINYKAPMGSGHKHRTSCVLHFIFCLDCGPLTEGSQ